MSVRPRHYSTAITNAAREGAPSWRLFRSRRFTARQYFIHYQGNAAIVESYNPLALVYAPVIVQ